MTDVERAALVAEIAANLNIALPFRKAKAILAAIEPVIRAAALEEAARFVEMHRVAHINNPPFHVVNANSPPMDDPDASQKALAAAIRALKDKP